MSKGGWGWSKEDSGKQGQGDGPHRELPVLKDYYDDVDLDDLDILHKLTKD